MSVYICLSAVQKYVTVRAKKCYVEILHLCRREFVGKKVEKVKDTKVGLKLLILFIETNIDLYSKNNKKK